MVEALRRLVHREGGYVAVADAIGANRQSLYQIVAGIKLPSGATKGVGPSLRKRLSARFPDWLNPQHPLVGTDAGGAVAQDLSLSKFDHPPTITLGANMDWNQLPNDFEAAMPDDALAPHYPRGLVFIWSRSRPARAGSVVLVRDRHDQPHVREYHPGIEPGRWTAAATNRAYPVLDDQSATVMATARFAELP